MKNWTERRGPGDRTRVPKGLDREEQGKRCQAGRLVDTSAPGIDAWPPNRLGGGPSLSNDATSFRSRLPLTGKPGPGSDAEGLALVCAQPGPHTSAGLHVTGARLRLAVRTGLDLLPGGSQCENDSESEVL